MAWFKNIFVQVLRQKELEIENLNLQLDRIKYENEDLRNIMDQNQKSLAQNELTVTFSFSANWGRRPSRELANWLRKEKNG